jgi:hypothetical protein
MAEWNRRSMRGITSEQAMLEWMILISATSGAFALFVFLVVVLNGALKVRLAGRSESELPAARVVRCGRLRNGLRSAG